MSAAALAGSLKFSYLCSIAWCPYGVFPETGGGDLIAPTPDGEPVHKLSLHFVAGFTIFPSATDTIPEQARTPSLASSHWSKGREGSKRPELQACPLRLLWRFPSGAVA